MDYKHVYLNCKKSAVQLPHFEDRSVSCIVVLQALILLHLLWLVGWYFSGFCITQKNSHGYIKSEIFGKWHLFQVERAIGYTRLAGVDSPGASGLPCSLSTNNVMEKLSHL
jgi:hypothetical protein